MNEAEIQRQKEIKEKRRNCFLRAHSAGLRQGTVSRASSCGWACQYRACPPRTEDDRQPLAEVREFYRVSIRSRLIGSRYSARGDRREWPAWESRDDCAEGIWCAMRFSQRAYCEILQEIGARCARSVFTNAHIRLDFEALRLSALAREAEMLPRW